MSRIDIIVPCHNYGRFLAECVESVTSQSHRDLKVLIIDDASSDETPMLGEKLAALDTRVEFRRHTTRRGHIPTYNEGFEWAQGDYVLLLSADDFLLPDALERAAGVLDQNSELGLIYGPLVRFTMSASRPYHVYRPWDLNRQPSKRTLSELNAGRPGGTGLDSAQLVASLGKGNHISVATAVSRNSVQRRLGIYREDLPHSGDLEMWIRFAIKSKVGYLDTLQAVQRLHGKNMSDGYAGLLDFQQCVSAFQLHYRDIRDRLPDGPAIEGKIRRRFARKAMKWSTVALKEGEFARSGRLLIFALRERLLPRALRSDLKELVPVPLQ